MIPFVDNALNRITMYRLVLYYLIFLLGVAIVLSFEKILGYDPFAILFTVGILLAVCSLTNWIFSKIFAVPANAESTYISALILALIITPFQSTNDLWFLAWAGVWAMASKYIVAIHHKHLFNPVAFAVALTYFAVNQSASWWVGSAPLLPFVVIGGVLIVRKTGRSDLVSSFLVAAGATILAASLLTGSNLFSALGQVLLYTPLLFFAFIILTEPLTTPPKAWARVVYGALVGVLFVPEAHWGGLYTTPEIAILIGNLFSYLVSPHQTLVLELKRKMRLAPDIYEFLFAPQSKLAFAPGQYMEWTLEHADPDSRGNRRFFTLASSPTEDNVRLGVRFYDQSSTFKQALLSLHPGSEIVATQLAGDFVLPRNPQRKCVFIAGGIGITPFCSMLKYLLDTHQQRPIILFYANRTADDFVYSDVLERARQELGIQTVYTVTDPRQAPSWWKGSVGHITPEMIKRYVPDYRACFFYISGPKGMVDSFRELLRALHVKESHIKTDFFSGLA